MSRSTKIKILLAIDLIFLFVELIVGYTVGSLALVADSFHMLNDVMSLVVALYAIKLTSQTETDSKYSYGWHRAEILAALINGVFLLALCLSIFMEAMQRFFSTPEVSNPKLVVIVGSLGLASNILGLFLFHEHGHSHGHGHDHSPQPSSLLAPSMTAPLLQPTTEPESGDTTPTQKAVERSPSPTAHYRSQSGSSMYGHPAATRASLVQTAQEIAGQIGSPPKHRNSRHSISNSRPSVDRLTEEHFHAPPDSTDDLTQDGPEETSPLLEHPAESSHDHGHSHGGHSHASMNMRALVLHVMGDALGNVGVIATGLIIWLSHWSFKYYCDPVISLVITIIIFSSALPLVRSASFILLQGVPSTVSLDAVRESILGVDGVLSLHELHIWQLSETKIVASVHVLASQDHDFMPIASSIRKALHYHGIHSSTIQPEYAGQHVEDYVKVYAENNCLIVCPPDRECDPHENSCCPPPTVDV